MVIWRGFLEHEQFQHGNLGQSAGGDRESALICGGDTGALLDGFLGAIIRVTGACAGAVRVYSPNRRALHLTGAVGLPLEVCSREGVVDVGCGVCGQAAREGGVRSGSVVRCEQQTGSRYFGEDCRQVVAVPLEFRGNPVGLLNLFFAKAVEIPADAVLVSFAELLGIALENARLAHENWRMNLMAERQSMANDIHDSLAQTLVYARMRMAMLQDAVKKADSQLAEKCAQDVNEALGDGQKAVRELITHFRSQMDPAGLQPALQALADRFFERSGIEIDYCNRVAELVLPLEHELQVYHIVREVLANVAVHSGATRARLVVENQDGSFRFTIEDNGGGIASGAPIEGHYGLLIMRERAARLGGEIAFESIDGNGTLVRLSFPDPYGLDGD